MNNKAKRELMVMHNKAKRWSRLLGIRMDAQRAYLPSIFVSLLAVSLISTSSQWSNAKQKLITIWVRTPMKKTSRTNCPGRQDMRCAG